MPDAPCKDCPDRRVTESENCHMTCAAYLAFTDKCRRNREAESFQAAILAEHIKTVLRIKKKYHL